MNAGAEPNRLVERVDRANEESLLSMWRASQAAGMTIAIVADGELVMAASRDVPGRSRNRVMGLTAFPAALPRATGFFAGHDVEGWAEINPDDAIVAGLSPAVVTAADRSALFAAEATGIGAGPAVPGLTIREVLADEVDRWVEAAIAADSHGPDRDRWLRRMAPHLLGDLSRGQRRLYAAETDAELVGVGALFTHDGIGWLTAGAVRPDVRNRGIQRALIGVRAAAAARSGASHVASNALVGEGSDRNLARAGLIEIARRVVVPVPRPEELNPRE